MANRYCAGKGRGFEKTRNWEVFFCLQKQQWIWKVPNVVLQVRKKYNLAAIQLQYERECCSVSAWQFLKIPVCDNRNTVGVAVGAVP
jgi:hypothetical protein